MPKTPDAASASATPRPYVDQLPSALINAFSTNNRINQYLIENLPTEVWAAKPPDGKGRTIAAIVAHMHNVRVMWLKAAKAEQIPAQLDRATVTPTHAVQLRSSRRADQSCDGWGWTYQELPPRCCWISRLSHRPRRPSSRSGRHDRATTRPAFAAKSHVRHVGVGTPLAVRRVCVDTRVQSSINTLCARRRCSTTRHLAEAASDASGNWNPR